MSTDFQLFADGDLDADIALITAYLARELSLVQVIAVEERFARDTAFREAALPLLKGWTFPRSLDGSHGPAATISAGLVQATPGEIEAGWKRYASASDASARTAASPDHGRLSRALRIAAAVALVVLPVVGVAQLARYVAAHPGAPGHETAARALGYPTARAEAPVQVSLPIAERRDGANESGAAIPEQPRTPRSLGATLAASEPIVGNARQVVELRDGRLIVNDPGRSQLFVLDPRLRNPRVVLDSVGPADSSYGYHPSLSGYPPLSPLGGDSTFFAFVAGKGYLKLDGAQRLGRVMIVGSGAAWQPLDGWHRWSSTFGFVRPERTSAPRCAVVTQTSDPCGWFLVAEHPDRWLQVDTLGRFYDPRISGGFGSAADRWAVMNDGAIAILNASSYRIEWINTDRSHTIGPPIPYAWRTLGIDEKKRLADSAFVEANKAFDSQIAAWKLDSADVVNGRPWKPRLPTTVIGYAQVTSSASGATISGGSARAIVTSRMIVVGGSMLFYPTPPSYPVAIPDSLPPVDRTSPNTLMPDRANRLWIRTNTWTTPSNQPVVYDIVDRTGALVDRVQVSRDRTIVGFGEGDTVYLAVRSGDRYTIEKVRFR